MAAILVNKFFHEQYQPQLEPLNEIFFNKHPMLRMVEKIFSQWQTIARTQGYDGFKKAVNNGTALKKILMDLFGFVKVDLPTSNNDDTCTNVEIEFYELTPAGKKMHEEILDHIKQLKDQDPNANKRRGVLRRRLSDETELKINNYIESISKELDSKYNQIVGFGVKNPNALEIPQHIPMTTFYNHKYLIIDKNGVKFNNKLVQMTLSVNLGYKDFIDKKQNPKMITAVLLHEIGHNFTSFLLTPRLDVSQSGLQIHNPHLTKGDEYFADQFATMYGYGYDLIKQELKWVTDNEQRMRAIHHDYNYAVKSGIQDVADDEHPPERSRINNIINQMKLDLKDPSLSDNKRKSLQAILKQSRKHMRNFKKNEHLVDKYTREVSQAEYQALENNRGKNEFDIRMTSDHQVSPYSVKSASPKSIRYEMLKKRG